MKGLGLSGVDREKVKKTPYNNQENAQTQSKPESLHLQYI